MLVRVIAQQSQKFSGIQSHRCSPQASRHSRALSQARPGGPGPHLHLSIERTRQEPGHCLGVRQGWRGCFQSQVRVPNHWTTGLSLDERLSLFLKIPVTITVQKLGSANFLLGTAGQMFLKYILLSVLWYLALHATNRLLSFAGLYPGSASRTFPAFQMKLRLIWQ